MENYRYIFLKNTDPELYSFIDDELERQKGGIECIASENFTSSSVLDCLGSILTNKYSEGLPGKRYYGGNEHIDKIENLCITRALKAYGLEEEKWGVNVQPYSGSVANIAAFLGLIQVNDRIMGLDLPSGGHLSHGFYTKTKNISHSSTIFQSLPYKINESGYINYDELEKTALTFCPKLIICGASAYARDLDYARFRNIANKVGAFLLCDMAHISGFVVTKLMNNPFEYCDVVTTTTHKTLRGPRSAMIFAKKEYMNAINSSVFPGTQGGPHQHQIAAVAHQLLEAQTPEFKEYMIRVRSNARLLASELQKYGYKICTNGTDNHIVLVDLRNKNITGSKVEYICELVNISINKNSVYGDVSPLSPGGIRLGTSAMTTRGFNEDDIKKFANLLDGLIRKAISIQEKSGKKMVDFKKYIHSNETIMNELTNVKNGIYLWVYDYKFPE
jgi:glycine hydroxymethyltransferase